MSDDTKTDCQVIIVDDESRNIRILQEVLEDYSVRSARSGEECLELLSEHTPKIVFLDVMMPGLSGYEVCKRIKASPELSSIKVILLSGKAMAEEREEGLAAGADSYITKPFSIDEILDIVEKEVSY